MTCKMIVACDLSNGIGVNNQLPWHLPYDLLHFKAKTLGKSVVMGRKTFESIGKPLPNRHNVVLTTSKDFHHDGVTVLNSVEEVKEYFGEKDFYVIGGATLYKQFLPYTESIYMTKVQGVFNCDTFFPEIDPRDWVVEEAHFKQSDNQNSHNILIVRMDRVK